MNGGIELLEEPKNITDSATLESIIQTLKQLKEEHNCNYFLAHLQENHLGGTYRFIPEGHKPSKNTRIIETYSINYFLEKQKETRK